MAADAAARRPPAPGPLVPGDFTFGVATAGFQIEGGFNGPGQPTNNWADWERAGRVEPSGDALSFFDDPEPLLDRAAALGVDSLRLSVEWARLEPADGTFDRAAADRYAEILAGCADRGLRPLVTLHHFTHPAWLGPDLWLRDEAPARFAAFVERVLAHVGDRCRHWVTVNEPNIFALETFVTGSFPPGRTADLGAALRALDLLCAAHVRAADVLHRDQPGAEVGTNTFCFSLYELDAMPLDLLQAPALGVEPGDLARWLAGRRAAWTARTAPAGGGPTRALEAGLRRLAARVAPPDRAFPVTRALLAGRGPDAAPLLDVAQLDWYAPGAAAHLRPPGRATAGGRHWLPTRPLWEDPPDPAGLAERCAAEAADRGLPVQVVENGICNRVLRGRSHPRADGWTRDRYLAAHLAALVGALERGVPVTGYWHWTLADNYEWGSYEPRFGLYGVDRERGRRLRDTDAMGIDAAGAYRELIAALRRGDRGPLERAWAPDGPWRVTG
jgi:beta-glucosidase/6-phospho-beta-glucosidase/beta-galactosidase